MRLQFPWHLNLDTVPKVDCNCKKLFIQPLTRPPMKFTLCLITVLFMTFTQLVSAQTNEWTWMGGAQTVDSLGFRGTLGVPATENLPGSRQNAVTWTDSSGRFWLFGGEGFSQEGVTGGYLSDVWQYDPTTHEWTWESGPTGLDQSGEYGTKGTPSLANYPSGRANPMVWVDASGNVWLFGGDYEDFSTGFIVTCDDLWKFNPSTKEWTWVGGSSTGNHAGIYGTQGTYASGNYPGARTRSTGWVDASGNFWLFGGAGYDSTDTAGGLNDLWEFNPSTGQWRWMSGSTIANPTQVTGTQGVAAPDNEPAGINQAVSWTDKTGKFWIFGGIGGGSALWRYDPSTNEWTWMGGTPSQGTYASGAAGVYGTLQEFSASSVPGARSGSTGWRDSKGNLWFFGGVGYDANDQQGFLNDLWEYNVSTGEWAWMGGSASIAGPCDEYAAWCGQVGQYGSLQTPSFGSVPGSRYVAQGWTDTNGNFWLFGGVGLDRRGASGILNDLWEFQPNVNTSQIAATPVISPDSGTYTQWQTITISDSTTGAQIQYLVDDTPPALNYTGPITAKTSQSITAIASASGYANSNIAQKNYTLNLPAAATPTFSLPSGSYTSTQTVAISDTTPGATIYYAIGGVPASNYAIYTGPLTVTSSEKIESFAVAQDFAKSAQATAFYTIDPNPTTPEWTWMGGNSEVASSCYPVPVTAVTICGNSGWYGNLGQAAAGNIPGQRAAATTWTDQTGLLWMFGGYGLDSEGTAGYLNDLWMFDPTTNEWTWMGGASVVDKTKCNLIGTDCGQPGVYGTEGLPSRDNIPGSRDYASHWTDSNGNFWLFGGWGYDANGTVGMLNDLWEFTLSTHEWTWVSGNSTISCIYCGQAGIYGNQGSPSQNNIPGSREATASWVDHNGHFWIYGGYGFDARGLRGYLRDLWEYDPTTNEWSWIAGSQFVPNVDAGYPADYGALRTPSVTNNPWSLTGPASWTDDGGNLWLFGGYGVDESGQGHYMNESWEVDPSAGNWAEIRGETGSAIYGQLGVPAPGNIPDDRSGGSQWTDSNGKFWIFGGDGTLGAKFGTLGDLWRFDPSTDQWTWMGGSSSLFSGGSYGALGAPAAENLPGSRISAATWTDKKGNLWMFGGSGYDANDGGSGLNDMWEYGLAGPPTAPPPTPAAIPILSLASGTYTSTQTLTISDQTPNATIYYTSDGRTPTGASPIYSGPISVSTSETVQALAVASGYANSPAASAVYTLNLPAAAIPTFTPSSGTYSSAQTVTMADATPGAAIFYTTDGTAPTSSSTPYTNPITVLSTQTIQAFAIANGYAASGIASATYTINLPQPSFSLGVSPGSLTESYGGTGTLTLTVTPANGFDTAVSFACSGLPGGASCSFNPSTVTPNGSAVTTTLTVTAPVKSAMTKPMSRPWLPVTSLAFAVWMFGWRRRSRAMRWLVLLAACAAVGMLTACGGSSSGGGGGSTPTTSTVTVTATSGSIQQTTTFTLTVN